MLPACGYELLLSFTVLLSYFMNNQQRYSFDETSLIVKDIIKHKHKLIYLAGASASGKSYIGEELVKQLTEAGQKVLLISSDSYYSNNSSLKYMLYGTFDHPHLIDYDLLAHNLEEYFTTGQTTVPSYSFVEKRRTSLTPVTGQYDIVVVEGLYTISQLPATIAGVTAFRIFVNASHEEIIFRRLLRDQARVKEPLHAIIGVMSSVFPMWTLFGTTQKDQSDIVITNDYSVLEKEWSKSTWHRIDENQCPFDGLDKVHYITDYIYNDNSDNNGKVILSEVYTSRWWLLDHVIIHKRDSDPRSVNESYESISMTLYQPAIITDLHILMQLAWLVYEWSYEKVVSYYKNSNSDTQTVIKEKFGVRYKLVE